MCVCVCVCVCVGRSTIHLFCHVAAHYYYEGCSESFDSRRMPETNALHVLTALYFAFTMIRNTIPRYMLEG